MKRLILLVVFIVTASTAAFSQSTHTVIKQCLDSIVSGGNEKQIFQYDSKGNNILYDYFLWDREINELIIDFKLKFTYDNNGKPTYIWTKRIRDWEEADKYEYTYDNNGNRTVFIYYKWDNANNDWKKFIKDEYLFDLSYSIKDLIIPATFNYVGGNLLTEVRYYSWSGTDWIRGNVGIYYWSGKN